MVLACILWVGIVVLTVYAFWPRKRQQGEYHEFRR